MISCAGTFACLSNIRKYILLLAFWITSKTWQFHWSVLVMVTPSNLTLSTRWSSWEFTVTASKWCLTFLKSIMSSLHLSAFSWKIRKIFMKWLSRKQTCMQHSNARSLAIKKHPGLISPWMSLKPCLAWVKQPSLRDHWDQSSLTRTQVKQKLWSETYYK